MVHNVVFAFLTIRSTTKTLNSFTYLYFMAKIMKNFEFRFQKQNLHHEFDINV